MKDYIFKIIVTSHTYIHLCMYGLQKSNMKNIITTKKPKASRSKKMASKLATSCSQWLPVELLEIIVEKVVPLAECIRFGAVSKDWHLAASFQKQSGVMGCHRKQLPLLLIPTTKDKRSNQPRCGLYEAAQGKTYKTFGVYVPHNSVNRFCGASHGMLAYVDEDLVITLFNPLTRSSICLPPLNPKATYNFKVMRSYKCDYYINKVILSANPFSCDSFETLVIVGKYQIAHLKSGDRYWTDHIDAERSFDDIIYYRDKFLAVCSEAGVFSVEVTSDQTNNAEPYLTIHMVAPRAPSRGQNTTYQHYLAESPGGDLSLVRKFGQVNFYEHLKETLSFKVFKLTGNGKQWDEMSSIGNLAIFLGANQSICVSAPDFQGCQPNSIYFTDDCVEVAFHKHKGPHDMGVFNLGSRKMEGITA